MGSNSKRAKEYIEDRISALPDVIRSHILSFMPTTDAVKTCVLSQTWKNAWVSVPNLDLSVSSSRHGWSAGFVDRVLFFRGLTNIHKFRLKCKGFKNSFARIDLWINIAIRCDVVELDLDLSKFGCESVLPVELPRSIFVCKTLLVLKLKLGPNVIATAPTSNYFPSLKYLHVTLDSPRLLSMEKLFACCPELEDLIIYGTSWVLDGSVLNITISAPKLRRLKLSLSAYQLYRNRYKIFIKANVPNLENLDLKAHFLAIYFDSLNAKSLNSAKIELEVYHRNPIGNDFADRIHKFFPDISSVRYLLSLSAPILGDVDFVRKGYRLPMFNNLSQLELHHQTCCVWESLIKILNASPNLEYLVYQSNIKCPVAHHSTDLVHDWYPPEVVPICLSSCLERICLRGFKGQKGEIGVTEYLLKHGQVLNKLTIYTSDFWEDSVVEFWQKCSKLQRGSKRCKTEWIF